ncbi:hypothetical protein LX64_00948 [Chitinophaga skermanii]|uniref:Uncharacterized protein n=1 Tax=Chitinophaga skermanii TaxID=331697 RepID=A0A327QVF8_9BACT|nr:hypothetical protein LX64_00948 [Chitinophaga skermanii]
MVVLPQLVRSRKFTSLSLIQLRQRLKFIETHLYDLGKRISAFNVIQKKTFVQKIQRELLIFQIGYYFALYEHLYNILMEKEKKDFIAQNPRMKILFDERIVKDIQDIIRLREKAKKNPPKPL